MNIDMLTFGRSDSPVQVQLLSRHTVFDLVDILCKETVVGLKETVYDHIWTLHVGGREYGIGNNEKTSLGNLEMSPGMEIDLNYDFGCDQLYKIVLCDVIQVTDSGDRFPCRKPFSIP